MQQSELTESEAEMWEVLKTPPPPRKEFVHDYDVNSLYSVILWATDTTKEPSE